MDNSKKNIIYNPPLIIQISITEIIPFKEEFQNHISEYSLKFEETNNNKFNIYNLSYILKRPIDLIPIKTPLLNSIKIYLIKSGKFISKGILNLNKNTNEQIVKFKIPNNYINIKFNYILNVIDFLNNNNNTNNKNKILFPKLNQQLKNNIQLNESNYNNLIKEKIKNKVHFRNLGNNLKINNKKNYNHNNSCLEFGIYSTNNNSKDNKISNISSYDNRNISEDINKNTRIWINNTKILLKRIKRFLTLRNNEIYIKTKLTKSLSAKSIKSNIIYKNKLNKSLTDKTFFCNEIGKKYMNSSLEKKHHLLTSDTDIINKHSNSNINNSVNFTDDSSKKNNSSNIIENKSCFYSKTYIKKIINSNSKNKKNEKRKRILKINSSNNLNGNESKYYFSKINKKNDETNNSDNINIDDKKLYNMKLLSSKSKIINVDKKYNNNSNILNNRYNNNSSYIYDIENKNILINIENDEKLSPFKIKIHTLKNKNVKTTDNDKKIKNIKSNENIIKKSKKFDKINNNNICDKIDICKYDYIIDDDNNKENKSFAYFNRLKEDFYSLYNINYLNNVKDELLNLEVQLLLEKIIELIYEYHDRINEEKIIYRNLFNFNKIYKNQYFIYCKLFKKLNIIKKQKNFDNLNNIIKDYKFYERNEINICKNEVLLFKELFNNNKKVYKNNFNYKKKNSKILSKMLKNILIEILNNNDNKKIIQKEDKCRIWIKNNISEENNVKYNNKIFCDKIKSKNKKINYKIN